MRVCQHLIVELSIVVVPAAQVVDHVVRMLGGLVALIEKTESDANGGEPVFLTDGTPVGRVSSGAYGHSVGASIALCFINAAAASAGTELDIAILGIPHRAVILEKPPFDAPGERLRA